MSDRPWARKGFDMLMAYFPDDEVGKVEWSEAWFTVWLIGHIRFYAIFKATGAVYEEDLPAYPGAVKDDPFLVPEGSPYKGAVETRIHTRGDPFIARYMERTSGIPRWVADVGDWFGIQWQRLRDEEIEHMGGSYDFNFVTPHLATGAAPVSPEFVQALVDAGVTHVVDVTDGFDDGQLLASHPALHYCYNPTADDGLHPKPPGWFAKSLEFALPAMCWSPPTTFTSGEARARVYAHCSAGRNRGPSTLFAIMLALEWPPTAAEAAIRAARPEVTLAYKDDAVAALQTLGYTS